VSWGRRCWCCILQLAVPARGGCWWTVGSP
jgi:hypothetical protein